MRARPGRSRLQQPSWPDQTGLLGDAEIFFVRVWGGRVGHDGTAGDAAHENEFVVVRAQDVARFAGCRVGHWPLRIGGYRRGFPGGGIWRTLGRRRSRGLAGRRWLRTDGRALSPWLRRRGRQLGLGLGLHSWCGRNGSGNGGRCGGGNNGRCGSWEGAGRGPIRRAFLIGMTGSQQAAAQRGEASGKSRDQGDKGRSGHAKDVERQGQGGERGSL